MGSFIFAASLIANSVAHADAVCDWNTKAGDIVVSAKMGPPPANRALAIAIQRLRSRECDHESAIPPAH